MTDIQIQNSFVDGKQIDIVSGCDLDSKSNIISTEPAFKRFSDARFPIFTAKNISYPLFDS